MKIERGGIIRSISRISLYTKLIIAFLVIAIIPLLFASVITSKIVEDSVSRSVFEKNQNLASSIAQELNADFDGKIRALNMEANNPDIRSMDPVRQTKILQNLLAQYPDMGMAAIADANGTQVGRSDGLPNSSISYTDREYFQRMMKTGNTSVSDVLKAKSSNLTVIVIAVPIKNDDQTIRGALLANVQLDKLVSLIEETKVGRTGYAYVVDKDGKVIIHPDPLVVANATDIAGLPPVKAAISGNTGSVQYVTGGQTKLAGYSYVPITGWGLVAEQPLDEAMTDVASIRNTYILIIFCTVFVAGLIILALVEALFRPVALLTEAAENAARGDLTAQARVVSGDEIGTLAATFNTMITRIRKREEALTESHRRLEDIINFLPDPTFVINLEGKIIAWNKATEEMTGIPARDILGKGNYEHGLAFYGERHPILIDLILSDDKEIGKKYPEFQKTGDKFTGVGYIPLAYGGKGAHFVAISSPLYNTRGEITGAIESLRDVTDRKRAEELLRESEERYRALFRDNPSMFFTMDSEGKIISVNPFGADQLGYTVDELIGQPVLNVFYESDREAVAGQFKICLQNPGQIYHWQFRKIRKDGSLLWVEEVSRAICGSGSDMNVLVVCQDITERKRVENALYRATKKLNLLNSIAFTDIQNAIFSLSGYMELEKIVPINEKLQQFLDKEIGIVRTISESLKFVNMYQGLGLKPPAWQKVQQSFLMGISHLDILKFSRTLDVEGLVIYADPLLENVFFTLAENVVLHGKTATEISLWYHESPEGLTLFFEDNGMGIQNDMKEKIFDRRYQEGKGMGLFLVREILSITGITIKETGEPGKGARFEMTVPKEAYWFEWRP